MNEQWSVIPVISNVEKWGDCEKCERFPKQELMIMNLIYVIHSMYFKLFFFYLFSQQEIRNKSILPN